MNDANLSFSVNLPFDRRCDLPQCGKATKRVYRVNADGYGLSFCSNDHARTGLTRWEEKKKLGMKPGQPKPIDDTPEVLDDNLLEIEEKGME